MMKALILAVATMTALSLGGQPPIEPAPTDAPATTASDPASPPPPLTAELARARLTELAQELRSVTDEPASDEKSLLISELAARLQETAERTEDPELRSAAQINLGLSLHLGGDYSGAAESFREADLLSSVRSLRAEARFNLGHVLYASAIAPPEPIEQDAEQADPPNPIDTLSALIVSLRPAAAAFRAVLEEDPTRIDAAENCEKIRRQIHEAQQQIDQLEELLEQLKEQSETLNDLADQEQEASDDSGESDQSRREELEQQQEDISEQTDQALQQMNQTQELAQQAGQPQIADQIQQSQQMVQQAREAQDRAEQSLERGDLEEASEAQQEAADLLRQAAESMEQTQDENQPSEDPSESEDQENPDEHNQDTGTQEQQRPQTEEPGDQLVRDLLDREEQQREQREQRRRRIARPIRVERDW